MNRIITVDIVDEYCKVSNNIVGASGSLNAVDLEFTFNSSWDDTSKKVYFFNSRGLNPVVKLLLPEDMNDNGHYQVSIPSEPLEYPGKMRMTVKGVILDSENKVNKAMLSASYDFDVLMAMTPSSDTEPEDISSTQAEQFQAQLDEIKEDLFNASIVSDSVDICIEKAAEAKESEINAKESEDSAKYWADKAEQIAQGDYLTPIDLEVHNTSDVAHINLFNNVVHKIDGSVGNLVALGQNGELSDSGLLFSVVDGVLNVTYEEENQ